MGIISLLATIMDPFGFIRNLVLNPFFILTNSAFNHYKDKTTESVTSARGIAIKLTVIALAAVIIIWTSVFMYIAFYYTYMPAIGHIRPVHMQFKSCLNDQSICSFPRAHVSLTKRQQLLMVGQPYRIIVNIDMPESPKNQELGMFMVCAEMRDQTTQLRDHSCRATMLRYKSSLVKTISTWIYSPLYVFGMQEEKQQIPVELFTQYEDEPAHPVTDVYLEIQSKQIQFYAVTLHIAAHFTGLRYIMFHWPIISATIGISTNLFFILIVSILSWYHWGDAVWIEDAKDKLRKRRAVIVESKSSKRHLEAVDFSTSFDESNILDNDYDDIIDDEKTFSNKSDDDIEEIFAETSQTTIGDAAGGGDILRSKSHQISSDTK